MKEIPLITTAMLHCFGSSGEGQSGQEIGVENIEEKEPNIICRCAQGSELKNYKK